MTYCNLKKREVWYGGECGHCQDVKWLKGEKQFYLTDCIYMRALGADLEEE